MHRNEVMLVGRLSMEPVDRELPSGSLLTQWRVAVRRPDDHPGRQRSDAIECATFDDEVRHVVADWLVDDVIEVQGALRRRWWRGGSRYEVEVRTARRVAREADDLADQSKRVVRPKAQPKRADEHDKREQAGQHDEPERADQGEAEFERADQPKRDRHDQHDRYEPVDQHERGLPDEEAGQIKRLGHLMRGRRNGRARPLTSADPGDGRPGEGRGIRRRPVISLRRPRPAPAAPPGTRDGDAAVDSEGGRGAPGADDGAG
ncbi:hypothetical protein GCM10023194_54600 [Planotetraspora phitsanulokensis]|uniref:Single-stranded DNA-binding protein n=1 Tax=Planotetraspora phitsanulokensis TaxID=575192 RepID=A0A8J3UEB4_9ACTN|nr:single-stranded DNA-binding protein [Planotetraspora phitsanulokensis]GII41731.1 hypothetical protein Pph01_67340 [Planotetraspora phitsanulokensis]